MEPVDKVADRTLFSYEGTMICFGETYIETPSGRVLSLNDFETGIGLRDFTTAERKKAASSGAAMKDGSYPILNCDDAKNARQAIGRTPPNKRSAVLAHIKSRESALGCKVST